MKRLIFHLTVCLLIGFLFISTPTPASSLEGTSPQPGPNLHLTLGNPTNATTHVANASNFLMVKPQFALSYNHYKGGPNWVSWHLEAEDVGRASREDDFHPDEDLPYGFKRIVTGIYTHSGFERGHLCNSEDRTERSEDNLATFAMTNILPQTDDLNKGPWLRLEFYGRQLAAAGNELYIIAGGYGTIGSFGPPNRRVNVPRVFWKVIVVLRRGYNDLSRIEPNTRTIAVCVPNKQGIRAHDWRRYVATVREVESATRFNFFGRVPAPVQNAIETTYDSEATNTTNPCR